MFRRVVQWLVNAKAVVLAVLVHVIVIGILMVNLEWTQPSSKTLSTAAPAKTRAVDSRLIKQEMERQKQAELKKKQEQERQQKKIEAEKKRLADLEKKRQAKERELKRLADKKKKAEKVRKLAEKKKRELAEKKKREKAARDKKIAEQKRKAELERKQRLQREMEAALAAEETASLVEHYDSLINQHVEQRWDVPPDVSIKIGMSCQVSATLLPSGDVLRADIKVSSGNRVFDESALNAVRRAQPLPLPPAKENLFEQFRNITIPFILKAKKS